MAGIRFAVPCLLVINLLNVEVRQVGTNFIALRTIGLKRGRVLRRMLLAG
jgi:hypothetical protein